MAVVIRLKRVGAKKDPSFRIVVADSRRARDGRFIEQLGFYDPQPREAQYRVDVDRTQYWLGVGAQASDQVRSLLKKAGVAMPTRAKKPKKKETAPKPKPVRATAAKTKGKASAAAKAIPAKAGASARETARRLRKRADRAARRARAAKPKAAPAPIPPAAAEAQVT